MLFRRYIPLLSLVLFCAAVPSFGEGPLQRTESIRAALTRTIPSVDTLYRLVGDLRPLVALPEALTDETLRSALVNALLTAERARGPENTYRHTVWVMEMLAVVGRPSDVGVTIIALTNAVSTGNRGPDYRAAAITLLRALLSHPLGVHHAVMEYHLRHASRFDSRMWVRLAAFEALTDTSRLWPEDLNEFRLLLDKLFDRMERRAYHGLNIERDLTNAQAAVRAVLRHRRVLGRLLRQRAVAFLCEPYPFRLDVLQYYYRHDDVAADVARMQARHRAFFDSVVAERLLHCEERIAAQ